ASAETALALTDASGRITWANAAFHDLHGIPAGSFQDVLLRDLVVSRPGAPSPLPESLAGGFRGVVRHRRLDGSIFLAELSVTPVTGGLAIVARDVTTERKAAALHDCLLALLRAVRESPAPEKLFPVAHALLARLLPAQCFAVVGPDPETARVELLYSAPEALGNDVKEAIRAVTGRVQALGRPVCLGPSAWGAAHAAGHLASAGISGTSWLGAPLGDDLGVLVVWASGGAEHDEADAELLGTLAPPVGQALQRGRDEARRRAELLEKTALMDALSDAGQALVTLRDGFVVHANDAAVRFVGTTREELAGRRLLIEVVPPSERPRLARLLASPSPEAFETALTLPDGQRREVQMAIRAVDLPEGLLQLVVFHDVTTLVTSARTDYLTGLPNRRAIEEALTREWERLRRRSGAFALARGEATETQPTPPLSVVMIDIDNFSVFNDEHGHHTGDEMLRRTALVLRAALRSCDLVGRWGGEEFLAILPDTDAEGAVIVAERIRHAVEVDAFYDVPRFPSAAAVAAEHLRLQVTISLGVATAVRPASPKPDEVVRRADSALYEAKTTGRNRVASAAPEEEPSA
ncbi:MAG TPA: diguanylate cyclase, partial [Thermoanaerobaculia bacterium]|nr:diguanylate cyclase [Thermoanaerobaculia bacterium]